VNDILSGLWDMHSAGFVALLICCFFVSAYVAAVGWKLGCLLVDHMTGKNGGDAQRTRFRKGTKLPATLSDLGITKKQSHHSKKEEIPK